MKELYRINYDHDIEEFYSKSYLLQIKTYDKYKNHTLIQMLSFAFKFPLLYAQFNNNFLQSY